MPSFFGLNIAVSGLRAQQYAMDVTAHNIANAGTEGYHRQEAVMTPGNPLMGTFAFTGTGLPGLGTGVVVQQVRRMQSDWIDNQVRSSNQSQGMWDTKSQALDQVESILGEPGDNGISAALDNFWSAWEAVGPNPSDVATRTSLLGRSTELANKIRNIYQELKGTQSRADQDVVDNVKLVNQLAQEIASMNQQIRRSTSGGYQPNDLLDTRDQLVNQLSQIVDIGISGTSGPEMIISIGGTTLVQGDQVRELATSYNNSNVAKVVWSDDPSKPAVISGGQLKGEMDIRDNVLEGYMGKLDDIARTLAREVNALHTSGKDLNGDAGQAFFTDASGVALPDASNISAATICVNPSLADSSEKVVASISGDSNANDIAEAIAALQGSRMMDGLTIGDTYSELVSRIGVDSREAASQTQTQSVTLQQLQIQDQSASGVSLDEEMANMVKFQQAYNANARVFSVIDEMIDTVINRMGGG